MDDMPTGLYTLFEYLRKAGIPLGAGDYLLAVDTLRAGHGLEDLETLKFVCALLWTKSADDRAVFDAAFNRLMTPAFKPVVVVDSAKADDALSEPAQTADTTESSSASVREESEEEQDEIVESEAAEEQSSEEEEVFEGQAPLINDPGDSEAYTSSGIYQLTPRAPMSRREMSSIWRHLRSMKRTGPMVELDVKATVDRTGRAGHYMGPVLRARRQNQVRLLVLVDRSAFMTPFQPYIDVMLEGIRRSGLASRVQTCYFDGAPTGYLSPERSMASYRSVDEVLATYARGHAVLIVGDAGAGESIYRQSRYDDTHGFLKQLRSFTYLYAWLNPFPTDRWTGSTAEMLARRIAMFPMKREGVIDAVNILRGHPVPTTVQLDA